MGGLKVNHNVSRGGGAPTYPSNQGAVPGEGPLLQKAKAEVEKVGGGRGGGVVGGVAEEKEDSNS